MKSRTWMWTTPLLLFGILNLAVSLALTVAAADAQQSSIHRSRETVWAGGNHMLQTNRPLPQTSFSTLETNNNARYKVVPIGVLPGKTTSFLTTLRAVNNIEHVTGYSYVYSGDMYLTAQGFIWQQGTLKALPLLSGWPGAFAYGINDRDQVVGTANNIDSSGNYLQTAVLWDHGQPVNLGALQPNWVSEAFDVNIWGVAVGRSGALNANFNTPVVWYGGKIHALPLLPGFNGGFAWKINDLGVISGRQRSEDFSLIPCIWYWNGTGYTAVNLGSFGGDYGEAYGINNLNQTAGYSYYPGDNNFSGFLWDSKHGLQALALLPQDTDAQAYNINDLGQIVGDSYAFDSSGNFISQRSAIWEKGAVTDLQTLVPPGTPPLTYETGNINDLGEITVNATNPDGSPAALLLAPVRH